MRRTKKAVVLMVSGAPARFGHGAILDTVFGAMVASFFAITGKARQVDGA